MQNIENLIKKRMEKIERRVAIMSGKGGVGKSTVTALLAVKLARENKKVGILDADMLGPSIPKMFGLENEKVYGDDNNIYPIKSQKLGIKIISTQLLLLDKNAPIAWRGSVVAQMLMEFLALVEWGELDYLLVDMPPGTGDAALTLINSINLDKIIIVTSPQELAADVVEKAINLAKRVNIKEMGIIENMSYYICRKCGEKEYIFGKDKGKKLADKYGIKFIAEIPIDENLSKACDSGNIESYNAKFMERLII